MPISTATEPTLRVLVKALYDRIRAVSDNTDTTAADLTELAQATSLISGRISVIDIEEFAETKSEELRQVYTDVLAAFDTVIDTKITETIANLNDAIATQVLAELTKNLEDFKNELEIKVNELVTGSKPAIELAVKEATDVAVAKSMVEVSDTIALGKFALTEATTASKEDLAQNAATLLAETIADAETQLTAKVTAAETSAQNTIDSALDTFPAAVANILSAEVEITIRPTIVAELNTGLTQTLQRADDAIGAVTQTSVDAVEQAGLTAATTAIAALDAEAKRAGDQIVLDAEAAIETKLNTLDTTVQAVIDEKMTTVPGDVATLLTEEITSTVKPAIKAELDAGLLNTVAEATDAIDTATNLALTKLNDAIAAANTAAENIDSALLFTPEAAFLLRR